MITLSFARDIRPMFSEMDIDSMKGVSDLDLSSYNDVRANAQAIYERVADGSMPCDEPWPAEKVARFQQWMTSGMAP